MPKSPVYAPIFKALSQDQTADHGQLHQSRLPILKLRVRQNPSLRLKTTKTCNLGDHSMHKKACYLRCCTEWVQTVSALRTGSVPETFT